VRHNQCSLLCSQLIYYMSCLNPVAKTWIMHSPHCRLWPCRMYLPFRVGTLLLFVISLPLVGGALQNVTFDDQSAGDGNAIVQYFGGGYTLSEDCGKYICFVFKQRGLDLPLRWLSCSSGSEPGLQWDMDGQYVQPCI
jgi:hypothetical protein